MIDAGARGARSAREYLPTRYGAFISGRPDAQGAAGNGRCLGDSHQFLLNLVPWGEPEDDPDESGLPMIDRTRACDHDSSC